MIDKIKTIVCTGDSHTYGQGADIPAVLPYDFNAFPLRGGDLRVYPFEVTGYVTLLRNKINALTGSSARQVFGETLVDISGSKLVRIFLWSKDGCAELKLDGICYKQVTLKPIDSAKDMTVFSFYNQGAKTLEIRGADVYCTEIYSGSHAVINSGVGSCTSQNYISVYYKAYVEFFQPELVVIESHAINDWLNNIPLSQCVDNLSLIANEQIKQGKKAVLLTVSPILGAQYAAGNPVEYGEYINAGRKAAAQCCIPCADANRAIAAKEAYFSDIWHVNQKGHDIYFETINNVCNDFKGFISI